MEASPATASNARPALLVKLKPSRPWRIGPASGARDRVDLIYHSDTLFSAVTHAMRLLGRLEYWLEITARRTDGDERGPLVRFSSMFPFYGETLYVAPPRHIWPPPPSVRVHYAGARFIPLTLVESLFAGKPLQDDRWTVDGASECLVPHGRPGPFRIGVRSSAAVDRITGTAEPHRTACLEFGPKSGVWFGVAFADEITRGQWNEPLRAAIRLLADSGFGGERSRGWGRAHNPEFREGKFPQLFYKGTTLGENAQWTLSLISPTDSDGVDWTRGSYATTVRGGRIESSAGSGAPKRLLRMIEEGSVLHASALDGNAPNVAPEGWSHPVFHAGWAFAIPVPSEIPRQLESVEVTPMEPVEAEALAAEQLAAEEVPPDEETETVGEPAHLEDDVPLASEVAVEETIAMPRNTPQEIPTSDQDLEQLENQDPGGPNDDVMPPMNDPGPMEPPFSEPQDLTPIDPEPGFENPPGPNPDEPEKQQGPVE